MFLYQPYYILMLLLCTTSALPKNRTSCFQFYGDDLRPDTKAISESFATIASMVAVQAIQFYDPELDWFELDWWGTRLIEFALQWPHSAQIETALVQGAYNAMVRYGHVKKWSELEQWADRLIKVAAQQPENTEMQTYLARRACGAIYDYGANERWEDMERWGARLVEVVEQGCARWPHSTEFREFLAYGSNAALVSYGSAGKLAGLAHWGLRLVDVAAISRDNLTIQEQLAIGAVNAIAAYGAVDEWNHLEDWGERLIKVAALYPLHAKIQLELVKGSAKAFSSYSRTAQWDDLQRWAGAFRDRLPEQVESEELKIAWVYIYQQLDAIQRKYPNDSVAMMREEMRTRYAFLEIEKQPPVTAAELIRLYDTASAEGKQQMEGWLKAEGHDPIEIIRAMVA